MAHALPLFPLQTVLFPGGVLPLRIFEVRYLDLIGRCHKDGTPFGVVCLTQGREVRQPPSAGMGTPAETFHAVGTLAHITACEKLQAGLLLIRCRGGQRFRLSHREQMRHGLWTGEADYLADDPVVPVPEDLAHVRSGLQQLLQRMQLQMGPADTLPIEPPFAWDDCGWIANRWCDLLPVGSQLKQQLLALDNPLLRLELVGDLLAQWQIDGLAAT